MEQLPAHHINKTHECRSAPRCINEFKSLAYYLLVDAGHGYTLINSILLLSLLCVFSDLQFHLVSL